jgi:hypothetical protein
MRKRLDRLAAWLVSVGQGAIVYFLHRTRGVPVLRTTGAVLLIMGINIVLLLLLASVGLAVAPEVPPGLRTLYPRRFLLDHPPTTHGFGFQAEMLLRALAAGLIVVEVGAPIDESSGQRSKAITARNVTSVVKTIARTYRDLRVRRSGRAPDRRV